MKPNPSRNWSVEFRGDGAFYFAFRFFGTYEAVLARADECEDDCEWQVTSVLIVALGTNGGMAS